MVRSPGKLPTKTLWIFCEGQTERLYFEKLRVEERIRRLRIRPKESEHKNADGLIQEALDFVNKSRDYQEGDFVSCVFDRDANTDTQLTLVARLAKNNNFHLIFSNPTFEYWVLCHFGHFSQPYTSQSLLAALQKRMPLYKKNDPHLYLKTKSTLPIATLNAAKVEASHSKNHSSLIVSDCNPLTLIHHLIQLIDTFRN